MTTDASPQPLLTVSDVATRLAVSIETVRRWEREGILRGIRPGGHSVRFLAQDVEAMMQPTKGAS